MKGGCQRMRWWIWGEMKKLKGERWGKKEIILPSWCDISSLFASTEILEFCEGEMNSLIQKLHYRTSTEPFFFHCSGHLTSLAIKSQMPKEFLVDHQLWCSMITLDRVNCVEWFQQICIVMSKKLNKSSWCWC